MSRMQQLYRREVKKVDNMLSIFNEDAKEISIRTYDSVSALLIDNEGFSQLKKSFDNDMYKETFGYSMARVGSYLFMVRKYKSEIMYIEVLLG